MARRRTRAALVTPVSGPLARYGQAGAAALAIWASEAGTELQVIDAHPSAAEAMATATSGPRRPDVLFGPYGAGPAVAAARATPCALWNHGGATARLARAAFPHVVNVPAPASTYLATVLNAIGTSALAGRRALLLHSTTGFAQEVATGALQAAASVELAVTDLAFAPGGGAAAATTATDWHGADVLLVAGNFGDELAIAKCLLGKAWRAAAFVSAGVDEILQPASERLEGVYGPCQWLPELATAPEDGPDQRWFIAAYQKATGLAPPYPAAAAYGAAVVWERCAREAGATESDAVVAAATGLHTTTLFGSFHLHPTTGLQDGHRVGVVRWRSGHRVPVTGPTHL